MQYSEFNRIDRKYNDTIDMLLKDTDHMELCQLCGKGMISKSGFSGGKDVLDIITRTNYQVEHYCIFSFELDVPSDIDNEIYNNITLPYYHYWNGKLVFRPYNSIIAYYNAKKLSKYDQKTNGKAGLRFASDALAMVKSNNLDPEKLFNYAVQLREQIWTPVDYFIADIEQVMAKFNFNIAEKIFGSFYHGSQIASTRYTIDAKTKYNCNSMLDNLLIQYLDYNIRNINSGTCCVCNSVNVIPKDTSTKDIINIVKGVYDGHYCMFTFDGCVDVGISELTDEFPYKYIKYESNIIFNPHAAIQIYNFFKSNSIQMKNSIHMRETIVKDEFSKKALYIIRECDEYNQNIGQQLVSELQVMKCDIEHVTSRVDAFIEDVESVLRYYGLCFFMI